MSVGCYYDSGVIMGQDLSNVRLVPYIPHARPAGVRQQPHVKLIQRVSQVHVYDLGPQSSSHPLPPLPTPGYYQQIGNQPVNFTPMQIPPNNTMPLPPHYNSYFGTAPINTRPIPINQTPRNLYGTYDLTNRVMTFTPPTVTRDSHYAMDYMDFEFDEQLEAPVQASTSTTTAISSAPVALRSVSSATVAFAEPSRTENKENGAADDGVSIASVSGIRVVGDAGMRAYKRRGSDELINEETESETGFSVSGDEFECRSQCGCVHNCDDEDDLEPARNYPAQSRRNAFRSIGDILGYAQVVRAERMEALAELQNAVERFNRTRQQRRSSRQN